MIDRLKNATINPLVNNNPSQSIVKTAYNQSQNSQNLSPLNNQYKQIKSQNPFSMNQRPIFNSMYNRRIF